MAETFETLAEERQRRIEQLEQQNKGLQAQITSLETENDALRSSSGDAGSSSLLDELLFQFCCRGRGIDFLLDVDSSHVPARLSKEDLTVPELPSENPHDFDAIKTFIEDVKREFAQFHYSAPVHDNTVAETGDGDQENAEPAEVAQLIAHLDCRRDRLQQKVQDNLEDKQKSEAALQKVLHHLEAAFADNIPQPSPDELTQIEPVRSKESLQSQLGQLNLAFYKAVTARQEIEELREMIVSLMAVLVTNERRFPRLVTELKSHVSDLEGLTTLRASCVKMLQHQNTALTQQLEQLDRFNQRCRREIEEVEQAKKSLEAIGDVGQFAKQISTLVNEYNVALSGCEEADRQLAAHESGEQTESSPSKEELQKRLRQMRRMVAVKWHRLRGRVFETLNAVRHHAVSLLRNPDIRKTLDEFRELWFNNDEFSDIQQQVENALEADDA